ncbi:MAG TPA: hypothetical protein VNM90_16065 [Haliangium sp.]|nr:hypothetical protein [Haliangium sp.]
MRPAAFLVCLLGACTFQPSRLAGREDIDAAPDVPRPDAAAVVPPDASLPDAGPTVLCDFASLVDGQTLTPELVAKVNTAEVDRDPFITVDGTTLFLMSPRPGGQGEDIWTAKRADRDADFSVPVNATALNSSAPDTRVSMTADERILVLSSARIGPGFDVYVSEREDTEDEFPAPELLAGVNSAADEFDPVISLDGLRLYVSAPGSAGGQDLLVATRGDRDADFATPQTLAVVNTSDNEADPAFTADELVMVFARGSDLYYATRASTDQDFSAPLPLTSINTDARESDPFVTADGCELFFASDRAGGMGGLDLYRVRLGP